MTRGRVAFFVVALLALATAAFVMSKKRVSDEPHVLYADGADCERVSPPKPWTAHFFVETAAGVGASSKRQTGATVRVYQGTTVIAEAQTDATGHAPLRVPGSDTLWFEVLYPGFLPLRDDIDRLETPLVLKPGARVGGSVIDENNLPIAAVHVTCSDGGPTQPLGSSRSRRDGSFEVSCPATSAARLSFEKDGFVSDSLLVNAVAPKSASTTAILTRGLPVAGRIQTVDGAPVEHARVQLEGLPPVYSNANGEYELGLAPTTTRVIYFRVPNGLDGRSGDLTIVVPNDNCASGWLVLDNQRVSGAKIGSANSVSTVDADGAFFVDDISIRGATVTAWTANAISKPVMLWPGTGGTEIRLERGGAVGGQVLAGRQLENVRVTVSRDLRGYEIPTFRSTTPDEIGDFWIGGLSDGRYYVRLDSTDERVSVQPSVVTINVSAGLYHDLGTFTVSVNPSHSLQSVH